MNYTIRPKYVWASYEPGVTLAHPMLREMMLLWAYDVWATEQSDGVSQDEDG